MTDPEARLQDYRQRLFIEFVRLLDSRLKLLRGFQDEANKLVWEPPFGGFSRALRDSLFDSLIVTLSWIFSDSPSDKRSLRWYIEQVREHSSRFTNDELNGQLAQIETHKDVLDRVKNLRSRWLAHRDPSPFNDPTKFFEENRVTIGDVEKLVDCAKAILQEQTNRFDEVQLVYDAPIAGIESLTECIRHRNNTIKLVEDVALANENELLRSRALTSFLEKSGYGGK